MKEASQSTSAAYFWCSCAGSSRKSMFSCPFCVKGHDVLLIESREKGHAQGTQKSPKHPSPLQNPRLPPAVLPLTHFPLFREYIHSSPFPWLIKSAVNLQIMRSTKCILKFHRDILGKERQETSCQQFSLVHMAYKQKRKEIRELQSWLILCYTWQSSNFIM